jgi:cation diffusion facilitator family transporter
VPAAPDSSRGQRLVLIGLITNIVLAAIKLIAGLVGHSYALVADAIESMTDIIGSAVIWGGLHIGRKPADQNHPYGHGKAEAIAALIVAGMVLAAGIGIAIKAVDAIITPHHVPERFTLIVLVAVIVIKWMLFVAVRRAGHESGSTAVHTDAWHHVSDAITSLAALIGISIALKGGPGYERADAVAALIAAGVIIANGAALVRTPIQELMDKEPADVADEARRIAESVPGVVNTEKLAARKSGTRVWIDLHVRVPPAMSVREAHALSHRVKDAVRARMPTVADVLVHIEPAEQG